MMLHDAVALAALTGAADVEHVYNPTIAEAVVKARGPYVKNEAAGVFVNGLLIRALTPSDLDGVWAILEPVIRSGETYALPRDMGRQAALAYWGAPTHQTFVAQVGDDIVGTYYLRANQQGGGAHVANCGYMTAARSTGRGVARAMCEHSMDMARSQGFRAMQFNCVVSTNERALRLWQNLGFETLCRLPQAFQHPVLGYVDACVMFRKL